jgi:hypothetical protein
MKENRERKPNNTFTIMCSCTAACFTIFLLPKLLFLYTNESILVFPVELHVRDTLFVCWLHVIVLQKLVIYMKYT